MHGLIYGANMVNEQENFWLQECIDAFRKEDYDLLLKNAAALEKISADNSIARMYLGIAHYHKKMFEEARKIFYSIYLKKFKEEKKEDDDLLYYLALCSMYSGQIDRAIDILTKLEEKYPKDTDYKIMLYIAFNMSGNYGESTILLTEALITDEKRTVKTLEELLMKALENSNLSGTAKVFLVELVRNLKK